MHLADAFIQSDLQCIIHGYTFSISIYTDTSYLTMLVCFMDSLYIEASKRPLTTSHPFNYTNVSLKMSTNRLI